MRDSAHWATALRYVELNPVRARIAGQAEDHTWSSARSHLGIAPTPTWLDTEQFQRHWPTPGDWRNSLGALTNREAAALRIATRHETALGSDDFVQQLAQTYSVRLRGRPPWTGPLGRPRKPSTAQSFLTVTGKTRSA